MRNIVSALLERFVISTFDRRFALHGLWLPESIPRRGGNMDTDAPPATKSAAVAGSNFVLQTLSSISDFQPAVFNIFTPDWLLRMLQPGVDDLTTLLAMRCVVSELYSMLLVLLCFMNFSCGCHVLIHALISLGCS